ncbi:MAG: response regulator [Lawsonibacter sp.]
MRIAVIDDEKYSRIVLTHQIRQLLPQAEVAQAASGAQAMELLERQSFDVLFIDIRLGDMEGTTIAALARRLMPRAKIIFATAYSEFAVKAFELRADDYILKPFDPERIRRGPGAVHGAPAGSGRAPAPPPPPHRGEQQPQHHPAGHGGHHLYRDRRRGPGLRHPHHLRQTV